CLLGPGLLPHRALFLDLSAVTILSGQLQGDELRNLTGAEIVVRGEDERSLAVHHRPEGDGLDIVDVEAEIAFVELEKKFLAKRRYRLIGERRHALHIAGAIEGGAVKRDPV